MIDLASGCCDDGKLTHRRRKSGHDLQRASRRETFRTIRFRTHALCGNAAIACEIVTRRGSSIDTSINVADRALRSG